MSVAQAKSFVNLALVAIHESHKNHVYPIHDVRFQGTHGNTNGKQDGRKTKNRVKDVPHSYVNQSDTGKPGGHNNVPDRVLTREDSVARQNSDATITPSATPLSIHHYEEVDGDKTMSSPGVGKKESKRAKFEPKVHNDTVDVNRPIKEEPAYEEIDEEPTYEVIDEGPVYEDIEDPKKDDNSVYEIPPLNEESNGYEVPILKK